MFGQALIYSIIEKHNKQSWVLNQTNNLTKKHLMQIINKQDFACVVVNSTGQIAFYNNNFKSTFGVDTNIYKLIDKGSTE
jgi:hypothetical protein